MAWVSQGVVTCARTHDFFFVLFDSFFCSYSSFHCLLMLLFFVFFVVHGKERRWTVRVSGVVTFARSGCVLAGSSCATFHIPTCGPSVNLAAVSYLSWVSFEVLVLFSFLCRAFVDLAMGIGYLVVVFVSVAGPTSS